MSRVSRSLGSSVPSNRPRVPLRAVALCLAVVMAAVGTPLAGQGLTDYFNVESPQVHPIQVVRLGGHDYLAVCNTRDNSVEIWDTDETVPDRRLARVRVGLEPVSVRFNPRLGQLFVANFLGDSISVIGLSAPDGPGSLTARLVRTTWVGDEPLDVAFFLHVEEGGPRETFFVTHMSPDGFGWRDAITFDPVQPGSEMQAASVPIGVDTSDPPDGVFDLFVDLAAKEPRTVLVQDGTLLILPLKGSPNAFNANGGDFDLYCAGLAPPFSQPSFLGGLHTTGLNMTFDAAGTLYVVGGEALDLELADEPAVAAAPTGFVKSMFFRVDDPCSGSAAVQSRDVNLEAAAMQPVPLLTSSGVTPEPLTQPVSKDRALSMLTDVAAFDGAGTVPKVFFTAFSNDRVGVIEPDPAQPNPVLWALRRIDLDPVNGNPMAGPSGLALKAANPGMAHDPGPRLYVLNHLDGSITTIDPVTETLVGPQGELSLFHDPRPGYVTAGQPFLYSAEHSGTGFVSCASCHVFGRTDGRPWDLGTPDQPDVPIPTLLPDAVADTVFPADKGRMVTQSLQGLLNFELRRDQQFWVTNAPYHWRGDRASFLDFKPAFESLLLGDGISDEEMAAFEAFINSVHYPPNPKQPRDRRPSGVFGQGEELTSDGSSGAFRGLKFFHSAATVGQRSCVDCHALPEGSNNRITDSGVNGMGMQVGQPIETAALRGLFQKEAKRDVDGFSDPGLSAYTGFEGLFHTGVIGGSTPQLANLTASINAFNQTGFSAAVCGTPGSFCPDLQSLNQFVHEMDWLVGPLVGCPATVSLADASQALPGNPASQGCDGACTDLASTLDCMEDAAERANSGVVVQMLAGGLDRGLWYEPVSGLYHEEPWGGASLDRSGVIGLLTNPRERLVFQAVPLGSERRIAAPTGASSGPIPGPAPAVVRLLPMVAEDFYERVPELQNTWANLDNTNLQSIFLHTVRLYQWGLILEASGADGFGLGGELRHDAPRRFRVSGRDIRHGAQLWLAYHDDPAAGPVDPEGPLDQVEIGLIGLPLYPTAEVDPETALPVWETAAAFEPMAYYALMLGGPRAPGVADAYLDQKPFTFPMVDPALDQPVSGAFDPLGWGWVDPVVVNADGTLAEGGWQRLTIE